MTNTEKYLATINHWLNREEEEDGFTKFLRGELKTVCEIEELAPIDETETILNSSDVNLIDIFKASGIWFIYMTRRLYPSTPTYYAIKNFRITPALTIVATGWIIKNLSAKNNFRDAILGMDTDDNIENLWRYYEYENIYFIDKYGSPLFYTTDKYFPLVTAFGDAETWHSDAESSEWFRYETLVDSLFELDPDDSEEMNNKRIKLMNLLYYVAFVEYPSLVSRWMEPSEDNQHLPLPGSFLAGMLYKASSLSLRDDEEPYTGITVSCHIEKYNDEGLDETIAYCDRKFANMTDTRMKDIYTEYMKHISAIISISSRLGKNFYKEKASVDNNRDANK